MADGYRELVEARAKRYMARLTQTHRVFDPAERESAWADVLTVAAQDCDDDIRYGRVPNEENDR